MLVWSPGRSAERHSHGPGLNPLLSTERYARFPSEPTSSAEALALVDVQANEDLCS